MVAIYTNLSVIVSLTRNSFYKQELYKEIPEPALNLIQSQAHNDENRTFHAYVSVR